MQMMEEAQTRRAQDRNFVRVGTLIVILHILGYGAAAVGLFSLFANRDTAGAGTFAIASALSFGFLLNAYTR